MTSLPTRIDTPESPLGRPRTGLAPGVVLWALINTLTTTAVRLFLSTSRLVQVAETGIPYPVFVFTGSTLCPILIEQMSA